MKKWFLALAFMLCMTILPVSAAPGRTVAQFDTRYEMDPASASVLADELEQLIADANTITLTGDAFLRWLTVDYADTQWTVGALFGKPCAVRTANGVTTAYAVGVQKTVALFQHLPGLLYNAPDTFPGVDANRITVYDAAGDYAWCGDKLTRSFQNLHPEEQGDIGAPLPDLDEMDVWLNGGALKAHLGLHEKGIRITVIPAGLPDASYPSRDFPVPAARYAGFLKTARSLMSDPCVPAWLALVNPARVVEPVNAAERGLFDSFYVVPGSAKRVSKSAAKLPGSKSTVITFENGVRYMLRSTATQLTIDSSDTAFAMQYTIETIKPDPGLKPVIYLYPETERQVHVRLDYAGSLLVTDPVYGPDGWRVTAAPDGRLTASDGTEYPYLFWEGLPERNLTIESGAVVPGNQTESWLRETLPRLGLLPHEYEEMIAFWAPRMRDNPYNLISFAGGEYDRSARLIVEPAPDSVLRVHMVWRALDAPVSVPAQEITPFRREGFTVVEWGGTQLGMFG